MDRPGDVLVSGNRYSLFPPHVIHCSQCGNYLASGVVSFRNGSLCCFSNLESERESETELKISRQTIFGVYQGRGFGTRPYLRKESASPAAVEQPVCEHFGPLFRDHSE